VGAVRIGISGWRYEGWRGVFYPKGLAHARELEYASRQLPTIEINGTHYSLQRPECFDLWRDATPGGFVFAVKGSRFITHMKQLNDIERPLANFFAQGVLALGEKLGPLLWQFGPRFRFNPDKLEAFLDLLPRDTDAAEALARRRDARMHGRSRLKAAAPGLLRHAIEVRHGSFIDDQFRAMLRRQRVALVVADTAGKFPHMEECTADFMYLRLHGDIELYVSGYGDEALDTWAAKVRAWSKRGDVYCYFDNDAKVHAPFDARRLIDRL
jgi:uncharacterized protein YecE (DUF72 family)